MLNKKELASLLVKLNNRYFETGEVQYAEAYGLVAFSVKADKRLGIPVNPLPYVLKEDDMMTMINAGDPVNYHNTIAHRSRLREAEQKAVDEIKNLSWWRRLWKQF